VSGECDGREECDGTELTNCNTCKMLYSGKKIHSGTCFDFLKHTTPEKEKQKREELLIPKKKRRRRKERDLLVNYSVNKRGLKVQLINYNLLN
jgi:hypothetical protein